MIFSESWLREFVDPGMSTAELVETLTMAGLEVDNVTSAASQFSGVVVGRVGSTEQHWSEPSSPFVSDRWRH